MKINKKKLKLLIKKKLLEGRRPVGSSKEAIDGQTQRDVMLIIYIETEKLREAKARRDPEYAELERQAFFRIVKTIKEQLGLR